MQRKLKYVLMSHSQKIGQKHSIKIGYRSFEDVAKFKYLGTTLTDQSCMHKEIKVKKKGKMVLLRSTEAHLGERRCSLYPFLTSALEGGEWSASRPGHALPPGKEPLVPTV
jgi:hypothetical protein